MKINKEKENPIFKVESVSDKMVRMVSVNLENEEIKEVPKYKLPLGLKEGQLLMVTKLGMFELLEETK